MLELGSELDVESHSEAALVGHEPAWDVLAYDFYIGHVDHSLLAVDLERDAARLLKLVDGILRERRELLGQGLHDLAVFRAQGLEVGLDALDKHAGIVAHIAYFLHVHLIEDQVGYSLDGLLLPVVEHRYHDGLQGLTHLECLLATQREHHRRDFLGDVLTLLEHLVDEPVTSLRILGQVHRGGAASEVAIELVAVEGCKRSHEQRHRLQALVEGLVGCQLVGLAVESHIPVAQVVAHKG